MTKIEQLENQLRLARAELARAHKSLQDSQQREASLEEQRAPLLRTAKIGADKKAQRELDEVTRELNSAQRDSADLHAAIDQIDTEIVKLERDSETAQREIRIEQLRALMAERNRIGAVVEEKLNVLVKEISKYHRTADELTMLADELSVPNTTRGMRGKPILKDFLTTRLKFLFPDFPWIEPQQRLPLIQMERNAADNLETILRARAREAA